MSTHRTVIKHKVGLLRLAQELGNVSQACKVMGYSRRHVLPVPQAVEAGGVEALLEKSRRKPNLRNRTAPAIEEAIVGLAFEQPAFGQVRVSNELRKRGHHIPGRRPWVWASRPANVQASPGGTRAEGGRGGRGADRGPGRGARAEAR